MYGREWKRVAADIKTRTSAQIRSHAQKYFAKLAKSRPLLLQQVRRGCSFWFCGGVGRCSCVVSCRVVRPHAHPSFTPDPPD